MKYYRLLNGSVRAIGEIGDIDGDQSSLVEGSWVLMTAEEYELHKNPTKTEEQLRAVELATFNTAWHNLKIGYSPTLKEAFEIKYGNELGESYIGSTLYNCDTFDTVESTDHLYKCSQDNINILIEKKSSQYSSSDGKNWYGSLGSYPLDSIELGIVLLKANELVQALADSILGGQQ